MALYQLVEKLLSKGKLLTVYHMFPLTIPDKFTTVVRPSLNLNNF